MPKWKSKVSVPNCSCHLKPRPSIRVGKNGQNFEASRASSKAMATGSVEPASSTQASRKFFEAFKNQSQGSERQVLAVQKDMPLLKRIKPAIEAAGIGALPKSALQSAQFQHSTLLVASGSVLVPRGSRPTIQNPPRCHLRLLCQTLRQSKDSIWLSSTLIPTCTDGLPPKLTCSGTSASARLRSTKWC